MPFQLIFQPEAAGQLRDLEHDEDKKDVKKLKKVRKCLGLIETNPKHPGLESHKYNELKGLNGEDVWESYVENKVSTAWRVFWHYGPGRGIITIVAITPHP
ncbi:MAG TPA: hypothetical protein VK934_12585 [Fimbriimonas sp.]|nr:hypothetical protein [Fimbriimonas sp.]